MGEPTGRDAWIVYTNWKGETARRHILPLRHWFGETAWHGGGQWLLDAHDLERAPGEDRLRTFALAGIHAWAATAEALDRRANGQ